MVNAMADQAKNRKLPALSRERRSSHTDELTGIAASITAYYDLLTDEEVAEDVAGASLP